MRFGSHRHKICCAFMTIWLRLVNWMYAEWRMMNVKHTERVQFTLKWKTLFFFSFYLWCAHSRLHFIQTKRKNNFVFLRHICANKFCACVQRQYSTMPGADEDVRRCIFNRCTVCVRPAKLFAYTSSASRSNKTKWRKSTMNSSFHTTHCRAYLWVRIGILSFSLALSLNFCFVLLFYRCLSLCFHFYDNKQTNTIYLYAMNGLASHQHHRPTPIH